MQQRKDFGICQIRNKVYLIGGCDYGILKSCEVYDIETNTSQLISELNHATRYIGCCNDEDKFIYAVGVADNGKKSTIERYDIKEDQWTTLHIVNGDRFTYAGIYLLNNNMLLLFGGVENTKSMKDMHTYDIENSQLNEIE